MDHNQERAFGFGMAWGVGTFIVAIVLSGFYGCPHYTVWQQGMAGQARLKESESSRKILVEEAKAKAESAKLLADAEIERAKGVAEANKIIGNGLKGHEEYLMYLWIQSLGDTENHVVYVPTEANIPILEAGRMSKPIHNAPVAEVE